MWVIHIVIVCSKFSKDFGVIYGISKPKARTLLLCIEVLAERKIKHEKMNEIL